MKDWKKAHTFHARRQGVYLQALIQGQWRNLTRYEGQKSVPPDSKLREMAHVIFLNTGRRLDESEITFIWR